MMTATITPQTPETFASIVDSRKTLPPSVRFHHAALEIITMLKDRECPENVLFTIAAAPVLADENGDVDRAVDAAQIASAGMVHTPFAMVRAEMLHILLGTFDPDDDDTE